jgi:transcriptional regulator with XRE-family HTH domain
MTETFGHRLNRLRKERDMTVAQLAKEVGVSEGTIRQIEAGAIASPAFTVGLKLAHRLGVDPYYLAFGEGSTLEERVTLVERRLEKLERRRPP